MDSMAPYAANNADYQKVSSNVSSARLETSNTNTFHREPDRINTKLRYAVYLSLILCIFIACAVFWGVSRNTPLLFSLEAARAVENSPKALTFTWVLIGTILAFTTGSLFNQLLKISVQQNVAAHGLKIGLLEFWSKVYSRKWLHDHTSGRILLSIASVVLAVAFGLFVSAYTGLITPTRVYVEGVVSGSELDMSSPAFDTWFANTGAYLVKNCSVSKTYGRKSKAVTLALCPQVQDPLPFVAAGLAAIESEYAEYEPKVNVLGLSFNGTTRGVLPKGWNTIKYFDTFRNFDLPPVQNYNYSMIQQGISANVSCSRLRESNITWTYQGPPIITVSNGFAQLEVYNQSLTWGPNKAAGISDDPGNTNILLSGKNMIATFGNNIGPSYESSQMELAAYGTYAADWKVPNMTCVINPYIVNVNVSYSNATGLFSTEIDSVPAESLAMGWAISEVNNWLFRVMTVTTGNQLINSIIALQNTPSYNPGIFGNVTINWPTAMELLLRGMTEYEATRMRMILEAEIGSTNVRPSGFYPIDGIVSSWRLGYNGETGAVVILFPLMGLVLLISITVIVLGARTGISHVSKFDPTNPTHIIIASALGGRNGKLTTLNGEDAINADARALNLKIGYREDMQGFSEVHREDADGFAELTDLGQRSGTSQASDAGLFARRPFMRSTTG